MSDIQSKPTVVKQDSEQAFKRKTRHPISGKVIDAMWTPNSFGRGRWGVKFMNDPKIYTPHEIPSPNASGREPYTSKP